MEALGYSKKVIEHFMNPRNVGRIENPDGVGKVGNPVCGDVMELTIKVEDDRIVEVKFQTLGCAAAIATSSITTEMVKGMKVEEAYELITEKRIADELGGLPPQKYHCSILAARALKAAIRDYWRRQGREVEEPKEGADHPQERVEEMR